MNKPTTKTLSTFNIVHQRTGFDKDDIEPIEYKEAEANFDENGHVVEETHYTEEGDVDNCTRYEYDENGRVISSTQVDSEEYISQKSNMYYDAEGRLIKQGNMYGEDSPEYFTVFEYQNGLLMRQDSYDGDELDYTEKEYEYNEAGQCIKEIDYNDEGEKQYIIENQYNEKGLLVQQVRDEVLNKDRRSYQYEYDEQNNKIKDLIYNYNEELIAKVYYRFNENNQLIEAEAEDLDKYQKTTYQYEGDLLVKIELLDKQGNLQSWTEYQYDDYGNVASIVRHIHDEVDVNAFRILSEVRYEREYFA